MQRDLREEAKAYVETRRREGASHRTIALELGISKMTVQRWLARASRTSALVPVRVLAASPQSPRSSVVVTTSGGLRIEGLDLDAICTLVMRIG